MKHVAVDLGAESGRVIVGDLTALDVVHSFPSKSVRRDGHLRWDARGIFEEIKGGLKEAFKSYGDAIGSIGVDTWGVDYGLLDFHGELIDDPYHYRDVRTDGVLEEVQALLGRERIYRDTGIAFLPFNTLYQLVAAQRAGELNGAARLLTMPDLIHYWLSGVIANEFTIATTTQCYDSHSGRWAAGLLEALDIPAHLFGDVVMPGTVLGRLTPELANELSAPSSVVVVAPAGHDTGSAVAAMPGYDGEVPAYLSSGTWSLLGAELATPLTDTQALEANFTNEGGIDGGVRFLKNIMGLWILQECKREWDRRGDVLDYGRIVELAETAERESTGGLPFEIDVDDRRFLQPGEGADSMPARIAEYCRETGQTPPKGHGETAWGIFASLSGRYAQTLQALGAITSRSFDRLHVIGGGSQNHMLNRLTARACGIPVSAGPVEATALGNILVQARALKQIDDVSAGRALIREHFPLEEFVPGMD